MAFDVFHLEEWIEMIIHALTHSPSLPVDTLVLKVYARGRNWNIFEQHMQRLIHFLFQPPLRRRSNIRVDVVFTVDNHFYGICTQNSFCILNRCHTVRHTVPMPHWIHDQWITRRRF